MYLFYFEKTSEYSTFISSMETSFQIILGKFDLKPIIKSNFTAGSIIFSTYNIVIVIMMMNFLITIVSDNFSKKRLEAKQMKKETMFEHLCRKIKSKFTRKEVDMIVGSVQYINSIKSFELSSARLVNQLKEIIDSDGQFLQQKYGTK